ncbi:hypothetical protein K493DRAFT_344662 [Basidiobolus meristosporus CBS 931.73]|uniref:GIY-YIG domain-containing protein n=1 Tax=Basidiobolus meristosporus CBS 931.73 TaxID=1314790 RepID=A0A1Y1Z743_9FUNG|nr:hypothetical protein K493DRAFT_344662 [Basidiobolus meristosporus CBS 931.73]|eukprot:ORY06069.1 hypothetical protein K493DRAFT_344662 [Basidiobolus meristosporus CBS 931.73]
MLCVYILENLTGTTRTYVGFTVDLRKRLRKHNREIVGGARATEGRLWKPFLVITGFNSKKCGLQLEWRVKHPPRTWSQSRSSKGPGRRRRRLKNRSKSIIFPRSIFPNAKPANIYKEKFVKISCAKLPRKMFLAYAVCAILHLDKWTKNAIPLAEQGDIVLHWDDINDLESMQAPWPDHVQHKQFDWANFNPQRPTKTDKKSHQSLDSPTPERIPGTDADTTQINETPPNEVHSNNRNGESPASPFTDVSISPITPRSQGAYDPPLYSPLEAKSKKTAEIAQQVSPVGFPPLRRSPRIKQLNERLKSNGMA